MQERKIGPTFPSSVTAAKTVALWGDQATSPTESLRSKLMTGFLGFWLSHNLTARSKQGDRIVMGGYDKQGWGSLSGDCERWDGSSRMVLGMHGCDPIRCSLVVKGHGLGDMMLDLCLRTLPDIHILL